MHDQVVYLIVNPYVSESQMFEVKKIDAYGCEVRVCSGPNLETVLTDASLREGVRLVITLGVSPA